MDVARARDPSLASRRCGV